MRRRMIATAVLAPAAALASVIPATTAHAAPVKSNTVRVINTGGAAPLHALRSSTQRCAGVLIGRVPAVVAGKPVAELDVYATPSNGGTVIACTKHVGATRGVRLKTSAGVVGSPTLTSKKGVVVAAGGNFVSYAGPAAIGGVKGKYFAASGSIVYKGKVITMVTKPAMFPAK